MFPASLCCGRQTCWSWLAGRPHQRQLRSGFQYKKHTYSFNWKLDLSQSEVQKRKCVISAHWKTTAVIFKVITPGWNKAQWVSLTHLHLSTSVYVRAYVCQQKCWTSSFTLIISWGQCYNPGKRALPSPWAAPGKMHSGPEWPLHSPGSKSPTGCPHNPQC